MNLVSYQISHKLHLAMLTWSTATGAQINWIECFEAARVSRGESRLHARLCNFLADSTAEAVFRCRVSG